MIFQYFQLLCKICPRGDFYVILVSPSAVPRAVPSPMPPIITCISSKTLEAQLHDKDARILRAKVEQAADRHALQARLAHEDAKEHATQQHRYEEATAVARMREDMMANAKHSKTLATLAKEEEGKALLAQAQRELAEDQASRQRQKQRCMTNNAAMTQANQQLQELRTVHALREVHEATKIAAVVSQQEATAAGRVAAEKARFEAKQAVRQRIIDEVRVWSGPTIKRKSCVSGTARVRLLSNRGSIYR